MTFARGSNEKNAKLGQGPKQDRGIHAGRGYSPKQDRGLGHAGSGLAGRALARLEAEAAKVHASETTRRGFQAVSSPSGFQALIRHGKTIVEIQNDSFAVRQLDD
jgi:hypothetical protein